MLIVRPVSEPVVRHCAGLSQLKENGFVVIGLGLIMSFLFVALSLVLSPLLVSRHLGEVEHNFLAEEERADALAKILNAFATHNRQTLAHLERRTAATAKGALTWNELMSAALGDTSLLDRVSSLDLHRVHLGLFEDICLEENHRFFRESSGLLSVQRCLRWSERVDLFLGGSVSFPTESLDSRWVFLFYLSADEWCSSGELNPRSAQRLAEPLDGLAWEIELLPHVPNLCCQKTEIRSCLLFRSDWRIRFQFRASRAEKGG